MATCAGPSTQHEQRRGCRAWVGQTPRNILFPSGGRLLTCPWNSVVHVRPGDTFARTSMTRTRYFAAALGVRSEWHIWRMAAISAWRHHEREASRPSPPAQSDIAPRHRRRPPAGLGSSTAVRESSGKTHLTLPVIAPRNRGSKPRPTPPSTVPTDSGKLGVNVDATRYSQQPTPASRPREQLT